MDYETIVTIDHTMACIGYMLPHGYKAVIEIRILRIKVTFRFYFIAPRFIFL